MKSRLIILSDLWGNTNNEWMTAYTEALQNEYLITYYDCRRLAQIDINLIDEDKIHKQFIDGGIDKAVANLLAAVQERVSVLAFSVGGTIAWKASLLGLKVDAFCAISSTRLRYETRRPACDVMLGFGEKDEYKPNQAWFDEHDVSPNIFENVGHELYKDTSFASEVCGYKIFTTKTND